MAVQVLIGIYRYNVRYSRHTSQGAIVERKLFSWAKAGQVAAKRDAIVAWHGSFERWSQPVVVAGSGQLQCTVIQRHALAAMYWVSSAFMSATIIKLFFWLQTVM